MGEEITVSDIMQIISGTDEMGNPLAAGSIGEIKINEDGSTKSSKDIPLPRAVFKGYSYGGAAVVTIDMPAESLSEFSYASKYIKKYLGYLVKEDNEEDIPDREKNKYLSLVVVPMLLGGRGYMVLNNIIFCDSYTIKGGIGRIILGFDVATENSVMMYGADIDLNKMESDVNAELNTEIDKLDMEIESLIQEKEKLERNNEYEKEVLRSLEDGIDMDSMYGKKDEEGYRRIGNFRFKENESEDEE